ncbi:MAG: virulence factor SrfB [Nitrospirae bacterium YQR-1]
MQNIITLTGNSGIQFIDLKTTLAENSPHLRTTMEYAEIIDGNLCYLVFPEINDSGRGYKNPDTGESIREDLVETVKASQALKCFEGRWIPLPYYRSNIQGGDSQAGPTNWTRIWFSTSSGKEGEVGYNFVLAFDTKVIDKNTGDDYLCPELTDIESRSIFEVPNDQKLHLAFLNYQWVDEWLLYYFNKKKDNIGFKNKTSQLSHMVLYLVFLRFLKSLDILPKAIMYGAGTFLEVDLVLDLGNSRSCGILIQTERGKPVSFTDSRRLEIRDLSIPDRVYSDPFEMHLEFIPAEFGLTSISKLSNRMDAFEWPSIIRVGNEALRHANINPGAGKNTGMSSPKRYLWDKEKRETPWKFNMPTIEDDDYIGGGITEAFNSDGELKKNNYGLSMAQYSRASMMTFVLTELFLHAISQINSYNFRKHLGNEEIPRKLKRIVLTAPTAMMDKDKKNFRNYAKDALEVLKIHLGNTMIDDDTVIIPDPDDTHTRQQKREWGYDEATCVQLVFLYGEICEKFLKESKLYFDLRGRQRKDSSIKDEKSVTIASIDIGGGTTDVMICSYQMNSAAPSTVIKPEPLFWEGFNFAGDEIVRKIIEKVVLPAIKNYAEQQGCPKTADVMNILFGEDFGGQTIDDRLKRKAFANQVAVPIAHEMIEHTCRRKSSETRTFDSFFINYPMPHQDVIKYVNNAFEKNGNLGFKLENIIWTLNSDEINFVTRQTVQAMLGSLCSVISQFKCDFLLLAGRPTVLPVIKEIILEYLPVTPDRVIQMGNYRVGKWYPFSDISGVINDPKTCVTVGASIALMSGSLNRLDGFRLDTDSLKEKINSTAQFIGTYDVNKGSLVNLLFKDDEDTEAELQFDSQVFLGMKQINSDSWITTPVYKVDYTTQEMARNVRNRLPLKITIGRRPNDREDIYSHPKKIEDKDGNTVAGDFITIKPQTLTNEHGYWLDTGTFVLSRF